MIEDFGQSVPSGPQKQSQGTEAEKQRLLEKREESLSSGVEGALYSLLQEQWRKGLGGKIDNDARTLLDLVQHGRPDQIRTYCTSTLHTNDQDIRRRFLFETGVCLATAIENSLRIGRAQSTDLRGRGETAMSLWIELKKEERKKLEGSE
ncbi:hypothetical protein A2949_00150 [Candidatus Adlerbacteria bacterium RIFCSPLOWO2_01_FULL_54_21b]|uniref:Uncharacterized protein n=1 Tax=Candidatus Adlerbacteria bacterium RIFCSPLOWO2_01_FULL_54_21b TaxID=1797245 RepID=A0A1F4XWT1_9BACT|nr:MAG: hypothetical protein A2949_00150 [Candidatus Adlerbacteria bacterium RIFCSPLOWO2_01_FULL_54_21b]